MIKTTLIVSAIAASALLVGAGSAFAGTTSYGSPCTASYGTSYGSDCTQTGTISINKVILDPKATTQTKGGLTSQLFAENLGANDTHFTVGQEVTYKIVVTNTDTKTATNVLVQDYLPKELTFVSGEGKMSGNVFSTTIASLTAGESRDLIIKARVADVSGMTSTLMCNVTNRATATAEGKTAEDNAALCIEKTPLVTKGGGYCLDRPYPWSYLWTPPSKESLKGVKPLERLRSEILVGPTPSPSHPTRPTTIPDRNVRDNFFVTSNLIEI